MPTFVERKFQQRQQLIDLFLGGQVRQARTGAKCALVQAVERGQPTWEELAINHALRQSGSEPESKPRGEFIQALADESLVARPQIRQAISNDHPIDELAIHNAPL